MDQNTQPPTQPTQINTPVAEVGRKKLPTWAKVLIIVGSIGLLAGIVGVIAISAVLKDNDKEVQGFLSSLYASNYSAAYDHFSPQLKAVQTQGVFESQVQTLKTAGVDNSCRTNWTTNFVSSSTDIGNTKEIGGTLDCSKGSFSASFKLVKQGDEYKLYSYSIQPK